MDELWSIVNEIGQHVSEWNAEEWAAAAGWATFLVAVIAGGIAWRQVREARTLRVEQAQPYMEQSPVLATAIELVVRNFGATAAHDVRLESTPGLRRTTDDQGGAEDVWVFDRLPLLAPGQEWRTVWDSSIRRFKTNLPDRHELVLRFMDSRKKSLKTEAVLDWSAYKGARYMKTYGIHHAAKALTGIVTEISKWREGAGRAGLKVFVRDGDARDEQARREFEAYRAEREAEQGASDQLLRYRNGKPITARRYDHLWSRLARHIP